MDTCFLVPFSFHLPSLGRVEEVEREGLGARVLSTLYDISLTLHLFCSFFPMSCSLSPFLASSLPASLVALSAEEEDDPLMRTKSAKSVLDKSTHERRDFVVNVCRTYFLLFSWEKGHKRLLSLHKKSGRNNRERRRWSWWSSLDSLILLKAFLVVHLRCLLPPVSRSFYTDDCYFSPLSLPVFSSSSLLLQSSILSLSLSFSLILSSFREKKEREKSER